MATSLTTLWALNSWPLGPQRSLHNGWAADSQGPSSVLKIRQSAGSEGFGVLQVQVGCKYLGNLAGNFKVIGGESKTEE